MRHILKRLRFHLARIRSQGLLKSSEYALFTALGERWGIEIQAAYAIPRGSPPAQDPSLGLSLIRSLQDLSVEDQSALTEYAGQDALHAWLRAFAAGRSAAIARVEGCLACVCWIHIAECWPPVTDQPVALLMSCFTLPAYRGRGLYAQTLRFGASSVTDRPVIVECSVFNHASLQGIEKAGAHRIGTTWRLGARASYRPVPQGAAVGR